jgi:hypothetical protein
MTISEAVRRREDRHWTMPPQNSPNLQVWSSLLLFGIHVISGQASILCYKIQRVNNPINDNGSHLGLSWVLA